MSWSREEALTDPAVRGPVIFLSEFKFHLRDIPEEITIKLYRPIHSGRVIARRSHDIVVDGVESGASSAAEEPADGEGEALHTAVEEMVCVYNAAREKGLNPGSSWLKPNPQFC